MANLFVTYRSIIPLREIIGNYNIMYNIYRPFTIIPLREIIGNYNVVVGFKAQTTAILPREPGLAK